MGRNCGWLTAKTAFDYRERLKNRTFFPEMLLDQRRWDIDAVYIPEMDFEFQSEVERLKKRMDEKDGINIFISEGAGLETIVREMEMDGEEVPRDAFGHVRLDEINPGQWFAQKFAKGLNADKVLVQKSGYFARSASPNREDLDLIGRSAVCATKSAMAGKSGVVGLDEENNNEISLIPFERIRGGKPFNINQEWFQEMLKEIGQTL